MGQKFVPEALGSLALLETMVCPAEMGEMVSKETLDLQVPWALLEECQVFLGVMGCLEPLVPLENMETRESLEKGAFQGFQLTWMRSFRLISMRLNIIFCKQWEVRGLLGVSPNTQCFCIIFSKRMQNISG